MRPTRLPARVSAEARPSFFRRARTLAPALLVLALGAPVLGCAGTASGSLRAGEGRIAPVDVRDNDFAVNLHKVLRDGSQSPERLNLLAGVVRRQLAHATGRFGAGHPERATDSVIGALYLVRTGEGRAEMVDATGERALAGAIERISPRGDEGRAQALMMMRAAALKPGSQARVALDEHLAALDRWMLDTHRGGPMEQLGARERAAVARALIDPSEQARAQAAAAVSAWIDKAIEYNFELRQSGRRPPRAEAVEVQRALDTGADTLAAIFLRHGDAKRALEHIDKTSARRIIQPPLYERIRSAADGDEGKEWQALAGTFAQPGGDVGGEVGMDPSVLAGGLWGAALEAYRRDPTMPDSALMVAHSLVRLGMSEGAPLVLTDAVAANPNPAVLSASMQMLLEALGADAEIDDHAAARRTFQAAGALLAAADKPEVRKRVEPSSARARFLMATIEVRGGNLPAARPLLAAAVAAEPSVSGYTILAMVERQSGNVDGALSQLARALAAPDARGALLDLADAQLLAYEIHRDKNSADSAKRSLDAALSAVLAAREQRSNSVTKARAERLLGRVLDGYGDAKGATRALERALALAAEDRPVLGVTMLDAVGRALVRRDVAAARAALARGLEGDVAEEDLVYAGLWLWLLERELKVPTDGTAEAALKTSQNRASWTSKLAAWAGGKLSDADLGTAAQTSSQKVEAAFYTAMGRKVSGDPAGTERLKDVVKSPVIDLLEVQLARELLAPRMATEMPRGVRIP
jgi:cellulose synthase operon protein C